MEKIIDIQKLSKAFGNKQILNEIDFSLLKGENVVILGKSGIGKSVLIKCIVGLIYPDKGTIKVLGRNVLKLDSEALDEVRRNVGYLFQSGAIYDSMSVRQNLEFPVKRTLLSKNKKEIEELTLEALENVGLQDSINKMPSELSGGMRKRLGLARTLILKPKIILYDEPTTGLDPVTSEEISDLILEVQEKYNTSSIIITHDMKCARMTSNRIKMLKAGNFYAEGTFDELRKSEDKEISAYFN